MKVLVTGFDPFGGENVNPAFEAIKGLRDKIDGASIVTAEVPTVFHKSAERLNELINKENPDVIVCVGQAGGRFGITPERVAINVDDARIADNEGHNPIDEAVQPDGPAAYFSSLPIKAMVKRMKEKGIPSSISNTAGTYVCNHLMYQLLYMIENDFPEKTGGFIHVPFIPEQVLDKGNYPSMSLNDITTGLEACIEAIVEYRGKGDLKETGGTTH